MICDPSYAKHDQRYHEDHVSCPKTEVPVDPGRLVKLPGHELNDGGALAPPPVAH